MDGKSAKKQGGRGGGDKIKHLKHKNKKKRSGKEADESTARAYGMGNDGSTLAPSKNRQGVTERIPLKGPFHRYQGDPDSLGIQTSLRCHSVHIPFLCDIQVSMSPSIANRPIRDARPGPS